MKNRLVLLAFLSPSLPVLADVNPDYFCHDLKGYETGDTRNQDSIATFWKNREGLNELRIAGGSLAPDLKVPGAPSYKHIHGLVAVFGADECQKEGDVTTCARVQTETNSPLWVWGHNDAVDAASHKVVKQPESYVKAKSVKAKFDGDSVVLRFETVQNKVYAVKLSCDAPSWEWYPHVPLDELGAKAH